MKKLLVSVLVIASMAAAVMVGTSTPTSQPIKSIKLATTDIANKNPQILPWVERSSNNFGGPLKPISREQQQNGQYIPPQHYYFGPQYQYNYPYKDEMFQGSDIAPIENRGEEYRRWLKASVRIRNGNVFGSGTICYYNRENKTAYVISCGHLFRGGEKTVEINVFYKNNVKLQQISKYTATVLTFSNSEDISFMSFQTDWDLDDYFPIAPVDYVINPGQVYNSCGCDGAREVALYLMKVVGIEGRNLVLVENGPRHGRSGGGLLTADGYYIGICWGSTDPYNGTGKGLFVPLSRIHAYAVQSNLGWLMEVGKPLPANQAGARLLPIISINGQILKLPPEFIPLP